jgi:PAS domain S-box-containing protein
MKTDRISLLLISSIVLTAWSAGLTYYMTSTAELRQEAIFRTYDNIRTSTELLSLLKDAETGERGYLLTGDTSFLHPFNHARATIPLVLDSIQQLAQDDSLQKQMLENRILPLSQSQLNQFESTIRIRQTFGADSSIQYLLLGQDKAAMDSLRELLHQFGNREKANLTNHLREFAAIRRNRNVIRFTSFFIIAAVSLLALLTIRQKQQKNLQLVKALRESNALLEQKVETRTRELSIKNELEEQLNDELRQTLEELQAFYDALQIRNSKAEDTLRTIRDLYDYAPCGYHSLAPDGTIVRINAMELLWLGYTSEEVIGKKKFTEFLTAPSREIFLKSFAEFKETGIVSNVEFEFLRKDGTTFPVLLSATALYDIDGNFVMSRATSVDISDRKYMEEELREANEKLRHVNEEKNHFLGMTAHDLKSPLNGVIGLIALLKNDIEPGSRQAEYLRYIEDACLNMKNLIMNLLDINRIEQGLTIINPEQIVLPALVDRHVRMLQENARKKNISLIVDDQAGPITLFTDPNALGRVLENLLSNALKFSRAGTTVTLRTIRNASYITFQVVDQGPGIRQEDMSRLFGRFQKLSARPTGGETSTGLGLSIVKELVTGLYGKISVTSEWGKGATFSVEIPLVYPA